MDPYFQLVGAHFCRNPSFKILLTRSCRPPAMKIWWKSPRSLLSFIGYMCGSLLNGLTDRIQLCENWWPWRKGEKFSKGAMLGYMDVSANSGTPKSIHFNRVFHSKPSILGSFPPIFGNTHMSGIRYDPQLSGDYFNKPWNKDPQLNNQDFPWKVRDPVFFVFCGSNEAQTWKIWIVKEVGQWVKTWTKGKFTPLLS